MILVYILLVLVALLVVLPITSYMMIKFGATGFYQARRREQQRNKNKSQIP